MKNNHLSVIFFSIIVILLVLIQVQMNQTRKYVIDKSSYEPEIVEKVVEKIIQDKLPKKSSLVYFDGLYQNSATHCPYNPDFPEEITNGVFYLYASNVGAKYYIWAKNELDDVTLSKITGWFVALEGSISEIPILFPIVQKEMKSNM